MMPRRAHAAGAARHVARRRASRSSGSSIFERDEQRHGCRTRRRAPPAVRARRAGCRTARRRSSGTPQRFASVPIHRAARMMRARRADRCRDDGGERRRDRDVHAAFLGHAREAQAEYSSTGTVTMPPPTPSRPAANPASNPEAARMAMSGSETRVEVALIGRADQRRVRSRVSRHCAVSVNGRPPRPSSAAWTSPTMDSAIDSGARPPMSSPTGARSRGAQGVGVGSPRSPSSFSRRAAGPNNPTYGHGARRQRAQIVQIGFEMVAHDDGGGIFVERARRRRRPRRAIRSSFVAGGKPRGQQIRRAMIDDGDAPAEKSRELAHGAGIGTSA